MGGAQRPLPMTSKGHNVDVDPCLILTQSSSSAGARHHAIAACHVACVTHKGALHSCPHTPLRVTTWTLSLAIPTCRLTGCGQGSGSGLSQCCLQGGSSPISALGEGMMPVHVTFAQPRVQVLKAQTSCSSTLLFERPPKGSCAYPPKTNMCSWYIQATWPCRGCGRASPVCNSDTGCSGRGAIRMDSGGDEGY